MYVTLVIIAFWISVVTSFLVSTVNPVGLEKVPEPFMLLAAAILVMAVVFVMVSSLRHLLGGGYTGSHKWLWFVVIFAGHIIGSTFYHFLVRGKDNSKNETAR